MGRRNIVKYTYDYVARVTHIQSAARQCRSDVGRGAVGGMS